MHDRLILPGATLGVFGSGQLGRMFGLAARAMGYRLHTFSPERDSPTGQIADHEVVAAYDDLDAVRDFVRAVDTVTFEFENVASAVGEVAESLGKPVRPSGWVLHTTQQRLREKNFLARHGLPVPAFAPVASPSDLANAVHAIGCPGVLKTAAFGYDGKGQMRLDRPDDALQAWDAISRQPAVYESFIAFALEISVVAARGADGAFATYGAIENHHVDHILDVSIAPARVAETVAAEAVELTRAVAEKLDVVGVLCVEFFVDDSGRVLINEIAPRPHNSGHLTIDASRTSQFEQQVRALCGLPLGSVAAHRPAAMANLLGNLWAEGIPDWPTALAYPGVSLHLYGKREARAGRKMGHLTALADSAEEAVATVLAAREALVTPW
jgi:5-(carboxyamino)imidazole ribonucleotide synthase